MNMRGRTWARSLSTGWLVVVPTLVIVALVLVLTQTSAASEAAAPQRTLFTHLLFQTATPPCQGCHPEQHAAWQGTPHAKAALDPAFQHELAKSHNQAACLQCHTTGFNIDSGQFLAEGVSCEACHGPYKPGHPAAETMLLPMESSACKICHSAAFREWEQSGHAARKIDCFDCHLAHSQGLRTGSAEKLCTACHSDQQTQLAHSVHGISGVECGACHMAKETKETATASGVKLAISSHSFTVPAQICNRCHSNTIHASSSGTTNRLSPATITDARQLATAQTQIQELQAELTAANRRIESLQNLSVVSIGLAFGAGGFLGLLTGIGGMALLRKRGTQ